MSSKEEEEGSSSSSWMMDPPKFEARQNGIKMNAAENVEGSPSPSSSPITFGRSLKDKLDQCDQKIIADCP